MKPVNTKKTCSDCERAEELCHNSEVLGNMARTEEEYKPHNEEGK